MFGKKKAKPVKRVAPRILETKFTCHACGRIWHIENVQQVAKLNMAAQMSNVGRSLTPILWLTKPKQTIDLRHCPSCGSLQITQTPIYEGGAQAARPSGKPLSEAEKEYYVDSSGSIKKREAKGPVTAPPSVEVTPPAPQEDVISKLERLGALKDKGIISDKEFEEQKAKLLVTETANQGQKRFDPKTGRPL